MSGQKDIWYGVYVGNECPKSTDDGALVGVFRSELQAKRWAGAEGMYPGRYLVAHYANPQCVVEKRVDVLPSHERLTRVLWETDPEVVEFVTRVGDFETKLPDTDTVVNAVLIDCARKVAAYNRAWERREPKGSVERADKRACMTLLKLASPSGGTDGGD